MWTWLVRLWNSIIHRTPQVDTYRPSNLHGRHR
jgi:hypothetical protein